MKTILVINPKGGSGKSTIATSLATYYAVWEVATCLVDYDPQQSSLEWLEQRPKRHYYPITGIDGCAPGRLVIPQGTQRVILDAPARTTPAQVSRFFEMADVVIIPVLPSPMDIRAVGHFLEELQETNQHGKARLGLVANRVKTHTQIFKNLRTFLTKQNIPLVTSIGESQSYIRGAADGYGIFEMVPSMVKKEIEHWRPLINWIEEQTD